MSALAPCPACQHGDHTRHVEHWTKAPEGVLGGAHCGCSGDCTAPDLSHIFGPMTARPDVPDTPDETTRLRSQVAAVESLERHWRHLGACSALIPAARANAAVLTAMADALRDTLDVKETR